MQLDRENMKKIMLMVLFTVLILVGIQRLDKILDMLSLFWQILFPFVLGAAMAFILNVPMHFLEEKIFNGKNGVKRKLARPLSLVTAIFLVLLIIYLVFQVVVPELGKTLVTLGKTVEKTIPEVQRWAAAVSYTHLTLPTIYSV